MSFREALQWEIRAMERHIELVAEARATCERVEAMGGLANPRAVMLATLGEVCVLHGVDPDAALNPLCRTPATVHARQETWLRLRELRRFSFPDIAAFFNMDHSSIQMGVRSAAQRRRKDTPPAQPQ